LGLAACVVVAGMLVDPVRAGNPRPAAPIDEKRGQAATAWLATIENDPQFQSFFDDTIEKLRATDEALRHQTIRAAVIDLPLKGPARLAHWNGDSPVYPASVPKFVYLMAAFAWRDAGALEIDSELDRNLRAMIYSSSNRATQGVVARLTDTEPGPRLSATDYVIFRDQRHLVKRWLASLGITSLHTVHPTYDGGDISARERQFLEDPNVAGSLPKQSGDLRNRQAMTANGSARLLALLATDRALAPATSEEVRRRMYRDIAKQPYLRHRIAGGGARTRGVEVYAKTGTWGPIHADAGIVRHKSGHQVIVAVFLEGAPRYRGSFIAELTDRVVSHLIDEK
jgi:beta-lactamase class A